MHFAKIFQKKGNIGRYQLRYGFFQNCECDVHRFSNNKENGKICTFQKKMFETAVASTGGSSLKLSLQ